MARLRRRTALLAAAFAAVVVGCAPDDRSTLGTNAERALADGRAYARALVAGSRTGPVDDETAIALGYLERLRLGLGGPFRLTEYALRDPRLPEETRTRLSWALLDRTLRREAYQIEPVALDRAGSAPVGSAPGIGRQHLALIDGVIRQASDPRGGELAVRLAYALAAVEHSADRWAFRLAVQAAALLRDRELARDDVLDLLREAEVAGADPLRLLVEWREERRFRVERPPLAPMPAEYEKEAVALAPRLMEGVRALGTRFAGGERSAALRAGPSSTSLLGPAAAERLAAVADSFDAPPQTPVVVAVDVHARELIGGAADGEQRAARERFAERARNEERFAAEYARLTHTGTGYTTVPARTALWAAVALRTYAQEPVWFPGFGGPTSRALEDRYGLEDVDFDEDVPAGWRPYYRHLLERSLADLQRVLPALTVRGLRVRFGVSGTRPTALAVHDPRRRTVNLPPSTSAGTIAHEIAHDLDWQVALRRYRILGDYGSDRAIREQTDRLAATLHQLAIEPLLVPAEASDPYPAHARRPAEVFARNVDWFVVVALAADGRTNGYLSSVQDDVLTGYGTVTPPDVTGAAGAALVSILDEVAPMYAQTRRRFLEGYGPARVSSAYDLVRGIADAALPGEQATASAASTGRFEAVERAKRDALDAIDAWVCGQPGELGDGELARARRRIVTLAAAARARGIAIETAGEMAGGEGRRFLARRFYGAPWPDGRVEESTAETLSRLADRARAVGLATITPRPGRFDLSGSLPQCAGTPIALAAS